jgi:Tfp pilus assembly protein PilV
MLTHRPDYYQGSHWFQGVVALTVLGVIVLGFVYTLIEMQERAEKLTVELTTRYMQTGVKLAVGEALLQGRSGEIRTWGGRNPVAFLAGPPQGYKGNCVAADVAALEAGVWCFDEKRRELLYRPRNQRHLKLKDVAAGSSPAILRWRVILREQTVKESANINVSVQFATQYEWFE